MKLRTITGSQIAWLNMKGGRTWEDVVICEDEKMYVRMWDGKKHEDVLVKVPGPVIN